MHTCNSYTGTNNSHYLISCKASIGTTTKPEKATGVTKLYCTMIILIDWSDNTPTHTSPSRVRAMYVRTLCARLHSVASVVHLASDQGLVNP